MLDHEKPALDKTRPSRANSLDKDYYRRTAEEMEQGSIFKIWFEFLMMSRSKILVFLYIFLMLTYVLAATFWDAILLSW